MIPHIHPLWLRHDIRDFGEIVMCASVLANCLPRESRLRRWPVLREMYSVLVDFVALLAFNWRVELPSLEREFFGFRRRSRAWFALRRERRRVSRLQRL